MEEDGDFDDDFVPETEGIYSETLGRKLKRGPTQSLLCSMVHLANNAQKDEVNRRSMEPYVKTFVGFFIDYFSRLNITTGDSKSFGLECSGLSILAPRTRIDKDKFVMSVELNAESKVSVDQKYCDNILGNEYLSNPYMIK